MLFTVLFVGRRLMSLLFFFNDTATTEIYTLSLHDALPISGAWAIPPWRATRSPATRAATGWRPGTRSARGGYSARRRPCRVSRAASAASSLTRRCSTAALAGKGSLPSSRIRRLNSGSATDWEIQPYRLSTLAVGAPLGANKIGRAHV